MEESLLELIKQQSELITALNNEAFVTHSSLLALTGMLPPDQWDKWFGVHKAFCARHGRSHTSGERIAATTAEVTP